MKTIKSLWDGKKMCEVYPHAKWYQVQLYYAKRGARRTVLVTSIMLTVLWSYTGVLLYGQYSSPKVIHAKEIIEIIKEKEVSYPVMDRIAKCESGGKHTQDGQVIFNGNTNKTVDIGKFQINSIWNKKATAMGLDLTKEEDNTKFAYWLYVNYGSEPWYSSKSCWNK